MTDEKGFPNKLIDWLKGDLHALKFCNDLLYISHLWDDLIDKDKVRTDAEIDAAFMKALAEIPMNPFYIAHAGILAPMIHSVSLQYRMANVLERGHEGERRTAYALRNALGEIVGYCIYLLGGEEWYMTAGLEFHRACSEHLDGLYRFFLNEMEVLHGRGN